MTMAGFLRKLGDYHDDGKELEEAFDKNKDTLRRRLKDYDPEELLELVQNAPESLKSPLLELAPPELSRDVLWSMNVGSRVIRLNEFSDYNREKVFGTYGKHKVIKARSESFLWNNVDALWDIVMNMVIVGNGGSR
jgi:hypothetical protein